MRVLWMRMLWRTCLSLVLVLGIGGTASAGSDWSADPVRVADLQDGGMLLSGDGLLEFRDFEFTAVGFHDSVFDQYLAEPRDQGFRLLLGLGDPFGPGRLEMRYTVTAAAGFAFDGAGIPFLALLEAIGASPLLEVDWQASNGASLFGTSDDLDHFPWPGVATGFDPATSLTVEQIVTLGGGSGIAKVENAFRLTELPEPGSGVLLAVGLAGALAARQRPSQPRQPR